MADIIERFLGRKMRMRTDSNCRMANCPDQDVVTSAQKEGYLVAMDFLDSVTTN